MTKYEHHIKSYWRPAIGWLYGMIVLFDFVLFPIGFSGIQFLNGAEITQWQPLTLKGSGLFHVSMLAIVGVTAYGRTQEKIQEMLKKSKINGGTE